MSVIVIMEAVIIIVSTIMVALPVVVTQGMNLRTMDFLVLVSVKFNNFCNCKLIRLHLT